MTSYEEVVGDSLPAVNNLLVEMLRIAQTRPTSDSMTEPSPPISDAELVARLKARDRGALEDLVRVHGGKIYGIAMQFMRKEEDAQEVMQDALVMIWKKIDSFEGRSAFTSWLYRVTANAALMALRKQKKHAGDVSLDDHGAEAPGSIMGMKDPIDPPDAKAVNSELGKKLSDAIDQLPESQRVIVLLRDVEGFSLSDTVAMTGLDKAAIKSRLHRARLALRKLLLPYLQEEKGEEL